MMFVSETDYCTDLRTLKYLGIECVTSQSTYYYSDWETCRYTNNLYPQVDNNCQINLFYLGNPNKGNLQTVQTQISVASSGSPLFANSSAEFFSEFAIHTKFFLDL